MFVEPDELRAAVAEVGEARAALGDARGMLDAAGNQVGGHDIAQVGTFVRQWRSEFELISELLGAFSNVLTEAARCYEGLDTELAQCLDGVGG